RAGWGIRAVQIPHVPVHGDQAMIVRTLAAVAAGFALAGPGFAQPPAKDLPLPPPVVAPAPAPADPGWSECGAGSHASGHWWASADAVVAWMQRTPLPELVTTSPAGTDRTLAGIPGLATTTTLFDGHVNDEARVGFRVAAGYWFDPDHIWGLEIGFMM